MRTAQLRCDCGQILIVELKNISKLAPKVAKLICKCGAHVTVQYKKKDHEKVLVRVLEYYRPQKPSGLWARFKLWLADKIVKSMKPKAEVLGTIPTEEKHGHKPEDAPRGA